MNRRTALFWLASLPTLAATAIAADRSPEVLRIDKHWNAYFGCTRDGCRAGYVVRCRKGDTARSVAESVGDRACHECGAPLKTNWRGPGHTKFGIDWNALG